MREELAALMHEIWADWMKFMLSCCVERYVIPVQAGRRWSRQMETPYDDLSEKEKDSDRREADKVLELFAGRLLLANTVIERKSSAGAEELPETEL